MLYKIVTKLITFENISLTENVCCYFSKEMLILESPLAIKRFHMNHYEQLVTFPMRHHELLQTEMNMIRITGV